MLLEKLCGKLAKGCGDYSWERPGESSRSGAKTAKWRELAAKLGAKTAKWRELAAKGREVIDT